MLTLTITNAPNEGRSLNVPADDAAVIGRDSSVDFQVMDLRMSRRHFLVVGQEASWRIRDLNSKHGTLVNNEQAKNTELRDGDIIRAGDTDILARFRDDLENADSTACVGGGQSE